MNDSERIDAKAKELGIEWEKVAASSGWHGAPTIKRAAIFDAWYDIVIAPIHEARKRIVKSAEVQDLFKKWFNAPRGTKPKPPIPPPTPS